MKTQRRIILVVFVLIGGTLSFGYWSLNQFNNVFDDLGALYTTSTTSVSLSEKIDKEQVSATSTTGYFGSITKALVTAYQRVRGVPLIDAEPSFTFPQKEDVVYIGCTYKISWQPPTILNSLEIALVDAGMEKAVESIHSGLIRENTIEKDSQYLDWKVGSVWPGEYHMTVSKIDGIDTEIKSDVFIVSRIPKDISSEGIVNICRESRGQL